MENKSILVTTEPGNAFARLLCEFRDGSSQAELSEQLQQLIGAVRETGKPGSITFTVKVRPTGNAISVSDEIKSKIPTLPRDTAIFFATEQNTLQRDNPSQKQLNLRTVEKEPAAEIRELPRAAAQA